jgi:Rho GTPase-activating protein 1
MQIENLLIPSSTYLTDRRVSDDIFVQHASGRRAFGARNPFPTSTNGSTRFPRVLRETTSFVLLEENITSEGLFRVPPHAKLREVLKEAYDRGQKYIVWKDNGVTLPVPPYPNAELQDEILAEVDAKDAYSVFMAAALIKAWYASLRQPIFPTNCYGDLKRLYGDAQDVPDLHRLTDLVSPARLVQRDHCQTTPSTSGRHFCPARGQQNDSREPGCVLCASAPVRSRPDRGC